MYQGPYLNYYKGNILKGIIIKNIFKESIKLINGPYKNIYIIIKMKDLGPFIKYYYKLYILDYKSIDLLYLLCWIYNLIKYIFIIHNS